MSICLDQIGCSAVKLYEKLASDVETLINNTLTSSTNDSVIPALVNAIKSEIDDDIPSAVTDAVNQAVPTAFQNNLSTITDAVKTEIDNDVSPAVDSAIQNYLPSAVNNASTNILKPAVEDTINSAVPTAVNSAVDTYFKPYVGYLSKVIGHAQKRTQEYLDYLSSNNLSITYKTTTNDFTVTIGAPIVVVHTRSAGDFDCTNPHEIDFTFPTNALLLITGAIFSNQRNFKFLSAGGIGGARMLYTPFTLETASANSSYFLLSTCGIWSGSDTDGDFSANIKIYVLDWW